MATKESIAGDAERVFLNFLMVQFLNHSDRSELHNDPGVALWRTFRSSAVLNEDEIYNRIVSIRFPKKRKKKREKEKTYTFGVTRI